MKKTGKRAFRKILAIVLVCMMLLSSGAVTLAAYAVKNDSSNADTLITENISRYEMDFNSNWKFNLGDVPTARYKAYSDSEWRTVELPHDFSIEQDFTNSGTETESGNLPGGTGWYRKMFTLPGEIRGKRIIINFDGAYSDTYVYVNNKYVGENHYGYNSFSFDITDYIACNGSIVNLIAVKVVNEIPNSRWYSGSGINRDVTLTITDPVHVARYGTKVVTTETGSGASAKVTGEARATVSLQNDSEEAANVTVGAVVLDSNGNEVSSESRTTASIPSKGTSAVSLAATVNSPKLWSVSSPNLYTMRVKIYNASNEEIDRYDTDFGYRTTYWDASTGFYLNGESTKLKGVCLHSDSGALGAVQNYDAIYRQMTILKDMGVNAVRTSHNVASQTFIDVCNDIGMLVMEEFFDGWDSPKNGNTNDFSRYFSVKIDSQNNLVDKKADETWAQFVVDQAVKRDRNSPSIIIWSAGNEIMLATSSANYGTIASNIKTWVSSLDSRPLTQGNNMRGSTGVLATVDGYMDVIGGNYYPASWVNARDKSKPFVATETASAVSSRGYYANSSGNSAGSGVKYSANKQINAYDASVVSWGNTAADAWYYAAVNDWFSGEFVWTGFDYIGEPTPWNNNGAGSQTTPNSSYFGITDTAGFPKDSYYLYRSMWNTDTYTTHLVPATWNKASLGNASTIPVAVYSNAKKVELYLNDVLIGYAESTEHTTAGGYTYKTWKETAVTSACSTTSGLVGTNDHDLYAQFGVAYAEGTLSVKAYDENNNEITSQCAGSKSVTSGAKVSKIESKVWKLSPEADGKSLIYIEYTAVDENGNFVNDYNSNITVSLNGTGVDSAVFAGADNGNAATTKKFQYNVLSNNAKTVSIDMFNGKALVIVKTLNTDQKGTVSISQDIGTGEHFIEGAAVTFNVGKDDIKDEFSEFFKQQNIDYEPTFYDIYNMLDSEFSMLDGSQYESNIYYQRYSAAPGAGTDILLETGYYGFTGTASTAKSTGVLLSDTAGETGLLSSGSNTFTGTSTAWYLEKQTDGTYYMSVTENGEKKYINIGSSNGTLTLSATPQKLKVTLNTAAKTVIIGNTDGTNYINYYGSQTNVVNAYESGTAMKVYTASGTAGNYSFSEWTLTGDLPTVEDGNYVIYNATNSVVVSNKTASVTALDKSIGTVSGDKIETDSSNVYTFKNVGGNTYYISDATGKYLNIGTRSLSLTDTPQAISVYARADGTVFIYNDSNFVDCYKTSNRIFSAWEANTSTTNGNEIHTLYKQYNVGISTSRFTDLYNAMEKAIDKNPGMYEQEGYRELLDSAKNGLAVLKSESSTDSEITEAVKTIETALKALKRTITKFNSTIYKYGFDSTKTGNSRYARNGGYDFSVQAVAQMKNAILANSDLVAQIEKIIGTSEQEYIESAAEQYARIYTESFQGHGVTNGVDINDMVGNKTAWSWWDKANSNLSTDVQNEGASVMGIYSPYLVNGVPVSHSVYKNEVPYLCPPTGIRSNKTLTVGNNTVTLTPLKNISVYAPDLFSRKNVKSGITGSLSTVESDATTEYSKYYWDTRFPFMTQTDEYGINTYTYDSNDTSYIYRACFDDSAQTAYSTLQDVETWDITRSVKGKGGRGLFPFNYQMANANDTAETSFSGENAIYHYGMTFDTEFTLPNTPDRKYNNGGTGQDVIFNFSGDDDVMVYVDGVMVLDNGGLHGARSFSINFTKQSVTYQYAYDIESGKVVTPRENTTYTYGDDANNQANGITSDIQLALEKLHEIYEAGSAKDHKLNFFYLERGSTDSNCLITFNLQPATGYVELNDEEFVADYGHDIQFDATDNNNVYDEAVNAGAYYEYLGIIKGENEHKLPRMAFTYDESNLDYKFADYNDKITVEGKFGTFTADYKYNNTAGGETSVISCETNYRLRDMQFTDDDVFYLVAKIYKDPIFTTDVYYTYEKITYVPATTIYYEDDYRQNTANGITYSDGAANAWQVVNSGDKATLQDTDMIGDSYANVYGYDSHYTDFHMFSNNSSHKVTVSGNDSQKWPNAQFKFAGTGFDVISLTSNRTGVFVVSVYNEAGKRVKYKIVDTYYGYSYGQIYCDADGKPTLEEYVLDANGNPTDVKNTVMYNTDRMLVGQDENGENKVDENGNLIYETNGKAMSKSPRYYDLDGKITTKPKYYSYVDGADVLTDTVMYISTNSDEKYTETPTYYDEDGNLTTTVTENPAYAYAYKPAYAFGWLNNPTETEDALYQIPVLKISGLPYGTYTAKIEARYAEMFDHTAGTGSYDLYLDAIRIYDPAGTADETAANNRNTTVSNAYIADSEAFAYYKEIRDMIIGSNTIDSSGTSGVLFIDGKSAVTSEDLEDYRIAGPNNELYLDAGQSVAFEILATSVPKDVQISAKVAKSATGSNPVLTFAYGNQSVQKTPIKTATDMYYSIAESLNLSWKLTKVNGKVYYTSGVIVIGNGAEANSGNILSVTNLKWTFDKYGAEGYYRIPVSLQDEDVDISVSSATMTQAVSLIDMSRADISIDRNNVSLSSDTVQAGKSTMVTIKTSKDVSSLVIKDSDGNIVKPLSVNYKDVGETREWSVQLYGSKPGTYSYTVQGVYENGYTDSSSGAEFTVKVVEAKKGGSDSGFTFNIIGWLINLILKIFGLSI